ncbi:MAG TPA: M20/M25/M40 family metallo-hydrolase [Chloroflexia bacterium]|nr:M20/M25/M40 family metallo-hydrolase [Chloroflexia bacterium]
MNEGSVAATNTLSGEQVGMLRSGAASLRDRMVAFAQKLVALPSLPGQEGAVARAVAAEMESLGYAKVWTDQTGNVIGLISANVESDGRPRRSVMFNTHMDQVDVGDPARWPFPPFEGHVANGELWGRGTSDLKAALAAQVYAGALVLASDAPRANDIYVTGVVQEEIGGHGAAMLAEELQTDYVVVGEPSANKLALGHRGRFEIHVIIAGKSVHASVPGTGTNPLYSMSRFLLALETLQYDPDPQHPALGPTTVAPTLISTDQSSANVVPGECKLVLDIRNPPGHSPEAILADVQKLLAAALVDDASGSAQIPPVTMTSYTGITRTYDIPAVPFGLDAKSHLAIAAHTIASSALDRDVPTQLWRFATDAGHFVARGMQVIGFGPGYEEVIHTVNERISIDLMVESMIANAALALALT